MRLTLCLPGLLLPRQALRDCAHDLSLPALKRILGIGQIHHSDARSLDTWIARRFGYERLPAAALRWLGEGGTPAARRWLCLDPVHLSVARNGVSLADPAQLRLTNEEDEALRQAVMPLMAEFGTLHAGRPGHWYIEIPTAADIETVSLPGVIGATVTPDWPRGADGAAWRRFLAEAQMLLHAHPVNAAREANGLPVVNSLWPWGEGAMQSIANARYDAIWSNDPVLHGLAQAQQIEPHKPPTAFVETPSRVFALIDDLDAPTHALDGMAWRDALTRLERDWFAPLAAAGRVELELIACGADTCAELSLTRSSRWKFWRRPAGLETLLSHKSP